MFALIKSKKLKHLSKIILSGAGNVKRTQLFKAITNLFLTLAPADTTFFQVSEEGARIPLKDTCKIIC